MSGVEFRGDINFGSGNNKLSAEDADGIYAYNIYFGDGNNTVTCSGSDIESGDHEADKSGEHGESKPGTGKIIFGNGKNKVVINNNGEIEGSLIKFGNGGNTVEINQGWMQTNPFNEYIQDDGYFNDGELDPVLWWNNIQAHGGISKITFGSGNDTIKLAGKKPFSYDYDADNFGVISTFEIDMGAGNDVIDLSSGGWITLCGTVDSNYNSHGGNILLGDGNDSLIMRAGSAIDAYGVIDFGSGDDKFTVAAGADIALGGQLDFGEGNDSITIDGKLTVWGYENFAGLENISGSGEIVIRGLVEDDLVKKFEDAGLKVSHLA